MFGISILCIAVVGFMCYTICGPSCNNCGSRSSSISGGWQCTQCGMPYYEDHTHNTRIKRVPLNYYGCHTGRYSGGNHLKTWGVTMKEKDRTCNTCKHQDLRKRDAPCEGCWAPSSFGWEPREEPDG